MSAEPEAPARWLTEVKIERFKVAFKPLPIPLRPFNVVVGRNGSGKSTLFEALQWLATAIRQDAGKASERYRGANDLVNLRSQTDTSFFVLTLTWTGETPASTLRYRVRVESAGGTPLIAEEELVCPRHDRRGPIEYLRTERPGVRRVVEGQRQGPLFRDQNRLVVGSLGTPAPAAGSPLALLADFWSRAVFLRLSPNRLADSSPTTRKSSEPLLDEEGQSLPALLAELSADQRDRLVKALQELHPGLREIAVSKAPSGRSTRAHYGFLERMSFQIAGRSRFAVPAWTLSEGIRRMTAILALLVREPAPSLLCIEEVENGLDPWTVRAVLRHLESAADRGTQVILTTHSPWLLDNVPLAAILQVRRTGSDIRYEHFASRPEIQAFDPNVPAGTRYLQESE